MSNDYKVDLSPFPWLKEEDYEIVQTQFRKLLAAKILLQKQAPFFYALISRLNIIPVRANNLHPTASVDSLGNVVFNVDWLSKMSLLETEVVLAHEVLHVALLHLLRLGGKHREICNIAQDIKVNAILTESDFTIPKPAIQIERYSPTYNSPTLSEKTILPGLGQGKKDIIIDDIQKKTADEIYYEIRKQLDQNKSNEEIQQQFQFDTHSYGDSGTSEQKQDKDGNSNGNNSSGSGNIPGFGEPLSEEQLKQKAREWKQAIATAAAIARTQGKMPGGIEALLGDLLEPKIDWRKRLWMMVSQQLPYDYSWSRPHKKSLGAGFYIPQIQKEKLDVVVTLDTSGSMSDKDLIDGLTEMASIASQFENVRMQVIIFDAEIHGVYDLNTEEARDIQENIKIQGRGGTDHRPVGKYIEDNIPDAKVVINFTDLYTSIPETRIGRWIWVIPPDGDKDRCPEDEELIILET